MRKIVVSEFVSLDEVMESPGPDGSAYKYAGWSMPYNTPESMKFKFDELMASDCLLLGRLTYTGFATAWPNVKDEAGFADKMNSMPKYVVSNDMKTATWNTSHIIKGDIVGEIKKLKQKSGGDILVNGSATLIQALIEHDLVDEYRLMVYPVVLGTGKRLFKDSPKANLKLISSEAFKTGVVLLKYQPAK
jgi:dihydrofolate reductase